MYYSGDIRFKNLLKSIKISLAITDYCNFHCSYCIANNINNTHHWTKNQIDILFDNLMKKLFEYFIVFEISGGEPLTHPLINYIIKKCLCFPNLLEINILTNGSIYKQDIMNHKNLFFYTSFHHKQISLEDFYIFCNIYYKQSIKNKIRILYDIEKDKPEIILYYFNSLQNKYPHWEIYIKFVRYYRNIYPFLYNVDQNILNKTHQILYHHDIIFSVESLLYKKYTVSYKNQICFPMLNIHHNGNYTNRYGCKKITKNLFDDILNQSNINFSIQPIICDDVFCDFECNITCSKYNLKTYQYIMKGVLL